MSISRLLLAKRWLAFSTALAFAITLLGVSESADASESEATRLATYRSASGETSFALSLVPPVDKQPVRAADIVVMFDTSATQTGVYRQDAMKALETFLSGLSDDDRVKLMAVDLKANELSEGFVAPNSPEMKLALKALQRRVPLGATDMSSVLGSAATAFGDGSSEHRNVVYFGEGSSKANLVGNDEFATISSELVKNQVAVSSFAIGPDRDNVFLAALANHTGGNLFTDANDESAATAAAAGLLRTVRNSVIWPVEVTLPESITETFPSQMPPLRTDRDTILLGTMKELGEFDLSINGMMNGEAVELTWPVSTEASNEDFAFLPELIDQARGDNGLSLPTVGSEGLWEMSRLLSATSDDLTKLGGQALAMGDKSGAARLADEALSRDPNNLDAEVLKNAIETSAPFNPESTGIVLSGSQDDDDLLEQYESSGAFMTREEQQRTQIIGRVKAEVDASLKQARQMLTVDPRTAVEDLKTLLEGIDRAPDLPEDIKLELRNKIIASIQTAGRRAVEYEDRLALIQQREAMILESRRINEELVDREQKIDSLVVTFNSLLQEDKYQEAVEGPAFALMEIDPTEPTAVLTREVGELVENQDAIRQLVVDRRRNYLKTMMQVELAMVPFPDEPPIVYPDQQFWEKITRDREKYKAVDLVDPDGNEARIMEALEETTSFEFFDDALQDAMDILADQHGIPIELDTIELEAIGLGSDTPISKSLSGISLRSGLRLLLKDLDLTYVVKDEVLLITTQEAAESYLITKVYNVGDLVVPIQSGGGGGIGGGGFGGGGFGGGGGGFGGGGGGFGGGGGGFGGGGGGFGGGGGGGLFRIQEGIKLLGDDNSQAVTAEEKLEAPEAKTEVKSNRPQPIKLEIAEDQAPSEAWNAYFSENTPAAADVRETARRLMNMKKFDETSAMILGALRNDQPQPWMYEALGIAYQATDAPQEELERALMSAVDFSSSLDESMWVAIYMSKIGLGERALAIFKDVAEANPTRHEPFMHGLSVAQQIEDLDGIRWACIGILSQNWPASQREIGLKAVHAAKSVMIDLKEQGRTEEFAEFSKAVGDALVRDVFVRITWTGEADIDLLVEEPSGTICSYQYPRTSAGGCLLNDSISTAGKESIDGFSEYYVCTEGFEGEYRVMIKKVWGEVTTGTVTVDVFRNYRSENQTHQRKQVELDGEGAIVLFNLEEGRRVEALEDEQIATIARRQFAVNRTLLAQQAGSSYGSGSALNDYYDSQFERDALYGRRPLRGAVGYRPVLTVLPEGANMFVTAVVSADRRYVRISPTPIFSQIVSVSTFNFAGGGTGGGGAGGGGGGLGGFGGGGGGGLGGGGGGAGGLF